MEDMGQLLTNQFEHLTTLEKKTHVKKKFML